MEYHFIEKIAKLGLEKVKSDFMIRKKQHRNNYVKEEKGFYLLMDVS